MADLANDIRLAVDSGKTAIGINTVVDSIKRSTAKLVIIANKNRQGSLQDILHMAGIAGIKVINYSANPVELGAICGKPFSVSVLSIIEPGNSNILNSE